MIGKRGAVAESERAEVLIPFGDRLGHGAPWAFRVRRFGAIGTDSVAGRVRRASAAPNRHVGDWPQAAVGGRPLSRRWLPWKDVVWAHADNRVLNIDGHNDVIGHAGIYLRDATLDARPVKIGGIGGVATRLDCRSQGVASEVMREAVKEMLSLIHI